MNSDDVRLQFQRDEATRELNNETNRWWNNFYFWQSKQVERDTERAVERSREANGLAWADGTSLPNPGVGVQQPDDLIEIRDYDQPDDLIEIRDYESPRDDGLRNLDAPLPQLGLSGEPRTRGPVPDATARPAVEVPGRPPPDPPPSLPLSSPGAFTDPVLQGLLPPDRDTATQLLSDLTLIGDRMDAVAALRAKGNVAQAQAAERAAREVYDFWSAFYRNQERIALIAERLHELTVASIEGAEANRVAGQAAAQTLDEMVAQEQADYTQDARRHAAEPADLQHEAQLHDDEGAWLDIKSPPSSFSPEVSSEPVLDPQEVLDDAAFEKSWNRSNTDPVFQPAHPGADLASFGIARDPSTMTPQQQADYAARTYAPNDMGIYETTGRLARGLAGEKAATEFLASEGHQILLYKPDITGTNQGGFDMVTMRGDRVYLVDNKAYRREGNLYSASALTTNFDQNLESTKVALQAMAHDVGRSEEERDTAQRAFDLIDSDDYQRLVTNASLSNIDNPGLIGVSDKLSQQEVEFLDLMRGPRLGDGP